MLTLKLNIINKLDYKIEDYIFQYTGLYYKLYNNFNLAYNKDFKIKCLEKFNLLDVSIYESCRDDVNIKIKQYNTIILNKEKQIKDIEKQLIKTYKSKKKLILKYKLINKLNYLKQTINKNICFGGKENLRLITKLSQNKLNDNLLKTTKQIYKKQRKLSIYLIGKALDKGNRKINFDLNNNKIIFKPSIYKHFEIELKVNKNQKSILQKLQELTDNRQISVSVRLNNDYVILIYDNELVNGYKIKERETYKEQDARKLKDKISNRYIAFDSNPEEIGFVIADKLSNSSEGDFKVIYKETISFKKLNIKLKLASSDVKVLYQNNKRKYELKNTWKYIFNLCKHYKVAYFVQEDLKFKQEFNNNNKEFNRLTKNIWLRTETEKSINKFCENYGIIKITINPTYSSFIGNMIYKDYDTIASATEICRRGITKYIKGCSIYPTMSKINQEKLIYLFGENIDINDLSWNQLYKQSIGKSYRNKNLNSYSVNYLYNKKSKIKTFR
jgi:IS605 OrfB family transposase